MRQNSKIFWLVLALALVPLACNLPTIPETGAEAGTVTPMFPGTPGLDTAFPPLFTTTPDAGNGSATQPAQEDSCVYRMTFLSDVTIPDNTVIPAGQSFIKTWRIRNDGTCVWGPGQTVHSLAHTGGERLNAPEQVPLPALVQPGETVDISVTMQAPAEEGRYVSSWMLRVDGEPSGRNWLGVGPDGDQPLYALIRVGDG